MVLAYYNFVIINGGIFLKRLFLIIMVAFVHKNITDDGRYNPQLLSALQQYNVEGK